MFGLEVDKDFIIGKIQRRLQELESDHPEINFHKDESYFDEEYDKVRVDSRKFINSDHEKFCVNSHNISQNIFRSDKQVYIHRYYQQMKGVLLACQEKDRLIISDSTYDFIMESKPPQKYEMKLWITTILRKIQRCVTIIKVDQHHLHHLPLLVIAITNKN